MSTRRKARPSHARSSSSAIPSPLKSSMLKSSPLKSSRTHNNVHPSPSSDVSDHPMEDSSVFSNEQSSALLLQDHDQVSDRSTVYGEQSSIAEPTTSASKDDEKILRSRTKSEAPSLPLPANSPLSRAFVQQLREFHATGPLVPPMSQERNILHNSFVFSLFECTIICALRLCVRNKDGSGVDDDTAAEIIKAMRDSKQTVDCRGLHQHIISRRSAEAQDKDNWETQVFNDLQNRAHLWSQTAKAYWEAWIAWMNNICRRYKQENRLGELTDVLQPLDRLPFRSVYEIGQPLNFMRRGPVQRNRQRPCPIEMLHQMPMPTQIQLPNQWTNQTANLLPMRMQLPNEGAIPTMMPMATKLQVPNQWADQNMMPMGTQMQLQNQWAVQAGLPAPVQDAAQRINQMPIQEEIDVRKGFQIYALSEYKRQLHLQQMQQTQQMQAGMPPRVQSNAELQMPAPTRPATTQDIATQMLAPLLMQPPTLLSQAPPQPQQQSDDVFGLKMKDLEYIGHAGG